MPSTVARRFREPSRALGPNPGAAVEFTPSAVRARAALRQHWPEYLMEAAELAVFMVAAALCVALLEHPTSPVRHAIEDATVRRVLTGLAMGGTAMALVYSRWGQRSGAHLNPSVTLTFWRLGKVTSCDAAFYIVAQFVGAVVGVLIAAALLGERIAHPAVNYVATLPGPYGPGPAFVAECVIAFGLMAVILTVSATPRLARYTGCFAGVLIATYISVEASLSGMSMNPARTFGPAVVGRIWDALWVYFVAPPLGMLAAAELFLRVRGEAAVACAKLDHQNAQRCIFCGRPARRRPQRPQPDRRGAR